MREPNSIIYVAPAHQQEQARAISIEQYIQRKIQRRRRVAKRMARRFPLFAVEYMQAEFPGYTEEEFIADITRKTRKGKSFRRPKSPLIRCARWPLYRKAMTEYGLTGDRKFLEEAQRLRNRMYLPIELVFKLQGEYKLFNFHCESPWSVIQELQKITGYSSWEELQEMIKEKTRCIPIHYSMHDTKPYGK